MTDEEKAEEYVIQNVCKSCGLCDKGKYVRCDDYRESKQIYLDGLTEGKRQVTDKTLSETRDILKLKKENEQLKTVCDYNCPVHKLVTHNTCLTCSAIKSSPHFDFKDKSDEEIKQIQAEAKLEAVMD